MRATRQMPNTRFIQIQFTFSRCRARAHNKSVRVRVRLRVLFWRVSVFSVASRKCSHTSHNRFVSGAIVRASSHPTPYPHINPPPPTRNTQKKYSIHIGYTRAVGCVLSACRVRLRIDILHTTIHTTHIVYISMQSRACRARTQLWSIIPERVCFSATPEFQRFGRRSGLSHHHHISGEYFRVRGYLHHTRALATTVTFLRTQFAHMKHSDNLCKLV